MRKYDLVFSEVLLVKYGERMKVWFIVDKIGLLRDFGSKYWNKQQFMACPPEILGPRASAPTPNQI